ncbi:hypothetical protein IHE45_18G033100 [Dioscorea alata]|uniref:Uncharacterized protein n=1 Tax=Dioscorea alata TaxID=55571 RepID=A0ACB7U667_DIOAL|nr:hypothetical protein IHE45_18G033100 [Dioscorea alata]
MQFAIAMHTYKESWMQCSKCNFLFMNGIWKYSRVFFCATREWRSDRFHLYFFLSASASSSELHRQSFIVKITADLTEVDAKNFKFVQEPNRCTREVYTLLD